MRRLILALALLAGGAAWTGADARAACAGWPAWAGFVHSYLSADGRVVDGADPARATTSEGEAYALLFALAAGDRPAFERVLGWTENNLAQGDLTRSLPAWRWGRRTDDTWGVIDANAATDADLWLAYALIEATRLWRTDRYAARGTALAARILDTETAELPGLGRVLLPGPAGFAGHGSWRLNPSYLPPFVLERLARATADPAWRALAAQAPALLAAMAPHGYAPDWARYREAQGFGVDGDDGVTGSYAAIRVYLWAGLLDPRAPGRARLLAQLRPMAQLVAARDVPPESIDASTGNASGVAPAGFAAALAPFLAAEGEAAAARRARRQGAAALPGADNGHYYDAVLALFADGYARHRLRFAADGRLVPGGPRCAA